MESFLSTSFLGRTVGTLLTSAAILVGGTLVALLVRAIANGLVKRRAVRADQQATKNGNEAVPAAGEPARLLAFALRTIGNFVFPTLVLATIYAAVAVLKLEGQALSITNGVFVVLFSLMTIRFIIVVVNAFFRRASEQEGRLNVNRLKPLRSVSVFVIWIVGLLFLLDNLGFDITTVVAGLGIGGIAVALAAQAVLGDLFSYFVILLDKPFEIGDFLIFGEILGSVEKIGIKTTRIRSLSGELITVSNSDLTSSRLRNYKLMEKRRVVFRIGVVYGTPWDKLQLIPEILREAVEKEELALFDRAHFASYGDWSLIFEVVYNVLSPDYLVYMDIQQRINLAIYGRFESEGVEFAYPTQTVKLHGSHSPNETRP